MLIEDSAYQKKPVVTSWARSGAAAGMPNEGLRLMVSSANRQCKQAEHTTEISVLRR